LRWSRSQIPTPEVGTEAVSAICSYLVGLDFVDIQNVLRRA